MQPRHPRLSLTLQADSDNNLLRRVNLASGVVTTLAGNAAQGGGPPYNYGYADGVGTIATFNNPSAVVVDAVGALAIVVRKGAAAALAYRPRAMVDLVDLTVPWNLCYALRQTRVTTSFAASI